jgi:radical SAM superfamily enzyme YgiQ (UPF0313 family)
MKFLFIDGLGNTNVVTLKKIIKLKKPIYPPLGLLYIGRALEDDGHKVEIIHYFEESFSESLIKKYLNSTDAVGLSISTGSHKRMAKIADKIKQIDSSIPIIIGGPHCTFHPKQSLNEIPSADISVEGEAEFSIKDIAKSLENNKSDLSKVEGIYYRENHKIKSGKKHKVIMDLDSILFPARHLVNKYEYGMFNNTRVFKPKLTSMVTSRGCPFKCRFCTRNALTYRTYRQRSAENVVKEIQEINEKYNSVFIVDDNFLADKKRAHKIFDMLLKIGTEIDFLIQGARVDSAERSLYKKMKKVGVKYIEFGIESGNQDVLDYYNKKITLSQIRKAVNLSSEMDFITVGNFILGASIETEREINNTIKFACSLPLDSAYFNPLGYMYGSDLWDEAVKDNIIIEDGVYRINADMQKKSGNFTSEELRDFCLYGMKKFYLRPNYLVGQFVKAVKRQDFSIFKVGLKNL